MTQHLKDLQGLRWAPIWAWASLAPVLRIERFSNAATLTVLVCSAALFLVSYFAVKRWYRDRYWLVLKPVAPDSPESPWKMRLLLALVVVAFAAWSLHPFDLVDNTPAAVLAWALLSPRCFEPVPASWVLLMRRMLYIAALLLVATVSIWHWFEHPDKRFSTQGLYISLLVVALYDHWLLETVLRGGLHGLEAAGSA